MVFLALAIRRMFHLDEGSTWREMTGFDPLLGVVLLFLVVLAFDRRLKRKQSQQGEG